MFGLSWASIAIYAGIGLALMGVGAWGDHKIENGRVATAQAATDTAKAAQHRAETDRDTAKANSGRIQFGLDQCNASVGDLKAKSDLLQKAAQDSADAANKARGSLAANIAAARKVQSTNEKCPAGDEIISQGFQ